MRIIEKGHIYELTTIDKKPGDLPQVLKFVNRETGTEHSGTQTQEVLRALIDRTQHCHDCLNWAGTDAIIFHLRAALVLHEMRALGRKVEKGLIKPENILFDIDGHFKLLNDVMNDLTGFQDRVSSGTNANFNAPPEPFRTRIVNDEEAKKWELGKQ